MKNSIKIVLFTAVLFCQIIYGQKTEKPKLIVGIIIDQMRSEYLYRFQNNYTEDGFKRLMQEGFNVKNTHYNYVPTATGPGHASVYTGTTPSNHGIVSNDWYSRVLKRKMYCAEDTTARIIDSPGKETKDVSIGSRSPKNLGTTTITDEVKLSSNKRSKVIGVSLKDRGAIFPSGHMANAAYWYNTTNGDFVTSSYYMEKLPEWLVEFNKQNKADSFLNEVWKPLLPIERYINSEPDTAPYEMIFKGKESSTFPYDLKSLRTKNDNFELLVEVPFGNTLLTELVLATIQGEHLGKGPETDFLTVSYSSTDYIGHSFGIRSKEIEDTYIRMDREIAQLLKILDKEVGKGNYTLFLTADHAASDNPSFLKSVQLPGKFYSTKKIKKDLNVFLSTAFGDDNYIAFIDKTQIYFNNTKTPKELLIKKAALFLKNIEGLKEIFAPELAEWNVENSEIGDFVKNSYHSTNSGDILFHFYSGWMEERDFGTTHGNAYTSDTHVPLLWYGSQIPKGESTKVHSITQIAPTISFLLNIPLPNASNKNPIEELFK